MTPKIADSATCRNPWRVSALMLGLIALSATACQPPNEPPLDVTQPFSLLFYTDEGSLPPASKRDVVLTVDASMLRVKIDSYGTTVADITKSIPPDVLGEVKRSAAALSEVSLRGQACPGGKSNTLRSSFGKTNIERFVARCGETHGADYEASAAVVEPLLALLGDRDKAFKRDEEPTQIAPAQT